MTEKETIRNKAYAEKVKDSTPQKNLLTQMIKAFVTGGLICVIGQVILHVAQSEFGVSKEDAGAWCSLILVFASAMLTGMGIYGKIVDFGGAGALVPITGFANSVCAPAIEYKKEGQVYGIGCKIFTIAGPVILYGIVISFVLGVLYWIGKLLGFA